MIRVALDLDSTLWDFHAGVSAAPGAPHVEANECEDWSVLPRRLGGKRRMLRFFQYAFSEEAMLAVGLLPGARQQVERLQDKGFRFTVLSFRPEWSLIEAQHALKMLGLPLKVIGCPPEEKVAYCRAHRFRALVDDHADTLRIAVEAGFPVYSLRYPWNDDIDGVKLASDWRMLGRMLGRDLAPARPRATA